jgi:septum site-determining protein MinD
MSRIISIHSFRGGTGKSNMTANLAAVLAGEGLTVGVVDTDIQSPGIHVLFGLGEERITQSLNDYLWGRCDITAAAYDVTPEGVAGRTFLIPSSIKPGEIARVLRQGYDVGLLNEGFRALIKSLALDVLLIDTHPGLNEETLLSIALSDKLLIVLRPDQQDYQGTGVTLEVARRLEVPEILLILNKVPPTLDLRHVAAEAEAIYGCEVVAAMPHCDAVMTLASAGIFCLAFPDDPLTEHYYRIANRVKN